VSFSSLPINAPSPLKLVLPYTADPAHYAGGQWKVYAWLKAADGSIGPESPEFASVRYQQRYPFTLPTTTATGGVSFGLGPFSTGPLELVVETREFTAGNSVRITTGWPPLVAPPFGAIYRMRTWDDQGNQLNIWTNQFGFETRLIPQAEFDMIDSITIHYDDGR
jgi:hypothetical protein